MEVLTLQNVWFSYKPGTATLRDVSLTVSRGEFLTIVGPNGSGKSTLLKLCGRMLSPQKGRIALHGKPISGYSRVELARRIAVVPQEHNVQFPFTVVEVVLMGRAPHCGGRAFESDEDVSKAMSAMRRTDIVHLAHQPVSTLSGGERQRTFIARALAQQPEIVLLDEPNAHLDIAHQVAIFGLMKEMIGETGLTVIAVSHDLNLAASYSDRIGLLLCGSLTAIGTAGEVLTSSNIRGVFQTDVLVDQHPLSTRPRVTLVGDGKTTGVRP